MTYRIEVLAGGDKWAGNALTFDTAEAAREWVIDLSYRWTLVRAWRVVNDAGDIIEEGTV